MKKETIKILCKPALRFAQRFPKNGKRFSDGDFAIINWEVIKILEGDLEVDKYNNIAISGNCFPADYSRTNEYTIVASLKNIDPIYGKQWVGVMCIRNVDLNDEQHQKIFLTSFLSGTQVTNLYKDLKDPLSVIDKKDINSLIKVKGIGVKTAEKIIEKYEDNKDYSEAYIELSSYGLTPLTIKNLTDAYGSANILINKVKENPYILASEVKGIGFTKADNMALNNGLNRYATVRLKAYIQHILNEAGRAGFSWVSSDKLVDFIKELDDFSMGDIVKVVDSMKQSGLLWNGTKGKVALKYYYQLEQSIKKELSRLLQGENNLHCEDWENKVKKAEKLNGYPYTNEQKKAIKLLLDNQVSIITGGAGTGKTTTVLGGLKALGEVSFAQCCLAGKAAAKLEEATGYPASTIHRLLNLNSRDSNSKKDFSEKEENQIIEKDVFVLDEFSMVGGELFLSLLKAIPTGSKLVLIGDRGQLPSIGALNIANDLTESKKIPTAILKEIHRQAKASGVITAGKEISLGKQIFDKDFIGKEIRGKLQDLELNIFENNCQIVEETIKQFKEKFEMISNDVMEVQILSPMALRGSSSVYNLNNEIQKIYNPSVKDKKEVDLFLEKDKHYMLRVGDKVINVKNNYRMPIAFEETDDWDNSTIFKSKNEIVEGGVESKTVTTEIFNGYIGVIKDITEYDELVIYFPLLNITTLVPTSHWKIDKGILLAYAITIHKFQGSSCKCPICIFDESHYAMLNRELLYTAITRSSQYCTVIAQNSAIRRGIRTTSVKNKQTFLCELLDQDNTLVNY